MRTPRRRRPPRRPKASTLIITLLVIVILSTIVVAFMQSMAIERMVARSYANKYRAELAAEAGVDTALRLLRVGTTETLGYAVIATNVGSGLDPVLLLAEQESMAPSNLVPLISGPISDYLQSRDSNANALVTFLTSVTNTNAISAIDVNRKRDGFRIISNQTNVNKFNAPWMYLTNSTGETNARFAFFVLDEQSKLNLATHGKTFTTNRAGWNSDPKKVPLTILGNTNLLDQLTASNFASIAFTNLQIEHLGQIFSTRKEYEEKKHLFSYLTKSSEDFIPAGYYNSNAAFVAYADAKKPKFNLNELATNAVYGGTPLARATNIAAIIDRNLPTWKLRDVAFTADSEDPIRYVQRIAASIVDYIDADSISTLLANDEPAGKELAPVVTSIGEKYNWISEVGSGFNWTNSIKHTAYVQVWNPYQTNVSGSLGFFLKTFRAVEIPGAIQVPMLDVSGTVVINNLKVNEYKVYEIASMTNVITSVGPQASLNQTNYPRMSQTSSTNVTLPAHSTYDAFWGGSRFDYSPNSSPFFDVRGPGLVKEAVGASSSTLISLNGVNRFSVNYPQYGFWDATKGYRSAADPRQNYLSGYVWDTRPSTNVNVLWNGRNGLADALRQDYQVVWALRDAPRTNPRLGSFVGSSDPTTASNMWITDDAQDVFAYVPNAGMTGIGELGNIYDPVQINDVGFATRGGNPNSWYTSGGGRTLRIGYAEFNYPGTPSPSGNERKTPSWNVGGMRSVQFLDLFSINQTNSDGVGTRLGKININTAHADVLTALFYNLSQTSDPLFTNSRMTSSAAASLAASVISNRPYWRLSDVYKFTSNFVNSTNFSPLLGSSSNNPAPVMDPAREQILSSVLDLLDTQTRSFKVVVIGQSLTRNNRVAGEAILEVIAEVRTKKSGANYVSEIVKTHSFLH